jgi:glutathione S-transferase
MIEFKGGLTEAVRPLRRPERGGAMRLPSHDAAIRSPRPLRPPGPLAGRPCAKRGPAPKRLRGLAPEAARRQSAGMSLPRPVRLFDCRPAPNPRRVRIFLAEKGATPPVVQVDIMAGAQFREHAARAGSHHVPALELEDGRFLTESTAICRYVEALWPEPNLMGRDPLEAAEVEMWARRVEFGLFAAATAALRHGNPKMAVMESPQCPEWAALNRDRALRELEALDRRLAASPFVAGPRYTYADIVAFVALDFLRASRIAVPETLAALAAWRAGLAERPAMAA